MVSDFQHRLSQTELSANASETCMSQKPLLSDGTVVSIALQDLFALSAVQRPNTFNSPELKILSLQDPHPDRYSTSPSVNALPLQSLVMTACSLEL